MNKKVISAIPLSELELQFIDGTNLTLVFDMESIANLRHLKGGMTSLIKESSIPEKCAKIIFIGAKSRNHDFTLEKARKLVSQLSPITITEIINEYSESMGATKDGVQSELQKKLMEEFLKSLK